MKNSVKLISLLFIMALFSCSNEPIIESELSEQSIVSKSSAKKVKAKKSTVAITDYNDMEIEGATSTLHRKKNKIMINFKTENLIPGNAYTLWFVVFGEIKGPPSSTFAAGLIANASGKGNFSGHLNVGDMFDTPNNWMPVFNTPLTAEIHIALRTHGPVQPNMMPDQIQTINGGCDLDNIGYPSGPFLYQDSDIVTYCANIQVAKYAAVN